MWHAHFELTDIAANSHQARITSEHPYPNLHNYAGGLPNA
jgi:hypothetical protein